MIHFVLDGRTVVTDEGHTVLAACREHGISLPTLCHLEGLSTVASCRLCLVEVDSLPRPVPACATAVWEGMRVTTRSARLAQHRRSVVALLFANGDHVCAACPASGCCELQDLAQLLGVDHVDLELPRRARPVDASRSRFLLDPGRCVLCTRCVRACAEIEGARTLGLAGRGARTRLVTDGGERWGDSPTCTDCGRCAAVCPTGALLETATAAQGLAARSRPRRTPARAQPAPPPLAAGEPGDRARLATVWLGGCSGCHMSLLDLDEALLALASRVDLVYSPLTDAPELPPEVDVCLVEGAVATAGDEAELRGARERARVLVALGDCACFGNVTAMRDAVGGAPAVLRRAWRAPAGVDAELPALLDRVRPVAELVPIDLFLPGCPPGPGLIRAALEELAAGRLPALAGQAHFG
ncbi:2Fe-2S iron-sulfur cluster-binding protein [Anaeromyxobacter diazotrophicus]|uniref:NADH-quinone oxidoreductase subunit B family protein n=1 Tax=Anaeromyxobacter diazotrophicus TaxID=2590199 RepID=UPI00159007C8|nr:2Fe-2S iron-sulfur cluster-binding protein [Anaeromyxobacter diazotrophicus]